MLGYALRRLLGVVPTFLLIVAAAFFLMRAAPGGPFDAEQTLPPEIAANLHAAYGLDQPVLAQFGRYLAGLARGDLGSVAPRAAVLVHHERAAGLADARRDRLPVVGRERPQVEHIGVDALGLDLPRGLHRAVDEGSKGHDGDT